MIGKNVVGFELVCFLLNIFLLFFFIFRFLGKWWDKSVEFSCIGVWLFVKIIIICKVCVFWMSDFVLVFNLVVVYGLIGDFVSDEGVVGIVCFEILDKLIVFVLLYMFCSWGFYE